MYIATKETRLSRVCASDKNARLLGCQAPGLWSVWAW